MGVWKCSRRAAAWGRAEAGGDTLVLKEAKMQEGSAPGATREKQGNSAGCSREGQRGCEDVLPLLEGMKSLALSLQ